MTYSAPCTCPSNGLGIILSVCVCVCVRTHTCASEVRDRWGLLSSVENEWSNIDYLNQRAHLIFIVCCCYKWTM